MNKEALAGLGVILVFIGSFMWFGVKAVYALVIFVGLSLIVGATQ